MLIEEPVYTKQGDMIDPQVIIRRPLPRDGLQVQTCVRIVEGETPGTIRSRLFCYRLVDDSRAYLYRDPNGRMLGRGINKESVISSEVSASLWSVARGLACVLEGWSC